MRSCGRGGVWEKGQWEAENRSIARSLAERGLGARAAEAEAKEGRKGNSSRNLAPKERFDPARSAHEAQQAGARTRAAEAPRIEAAAFPPVVPKTVAREPRHRASASLSDSSTPPSQAFAKGQ